MRLKLEKKRLCYDFWLIMLFLTGLFFAFRCIVSDLLYFFSEPSKITLIKEFQGMDRGFLLDFLTIPFLLLFLSLYLILFSNIRKEEKEILFIIFITSSLLFSRNLLNYSVESILWIIHVGAIFYFLAGFLILKAKRKNKDMKN